MTISLSPAGRMLNRSHRAKSWWQEGSSFQVPSPPLIPQGGSLADLADALQL